jgi:hypothetical protein
MQRLLDINGYHTPPIHPPQSAETVGAAGLKTERIYPTQDKSCELAIEVPTSMG